MWAQGKALPTEEGDNKMARQFFLGSKGKIPLTAQATLPPNGWSANNNSQRSTPPTLAGLLQALLLRFGPQFQRFLRFFQQVLRRFHGGCGAPPVQLGRAWMQRVAPWREVWHTLVTGATWTTFAELTRFGPPLSLFAKGRESLPVRGHRWCYGPPQIDRAPEGRDQQHRTDHERSDARFFRSC